VGSVSNIERRMSNALESAFDEALTALRASGLAHIDETPWKKRGILHWLWTGVGDGVTVHRIDRRRNREALTRLMGTDFAGIHVTDRLASYDKIPARRRQLCWAHLERDFRAFEQGPPQGRAFGAAGLAIAQALMRCVREYKRHGDRDQFEDDVRPYLGELIERLVDGACADVPKVSGFAAHLLARADSLWTFADHEGVPPTNNIAERAIRKAVLWRKNCFGSQSERGLRFAERMMTVIATKRRRGEGVLEYLVEVTRATITGSPAPPLMPQTAHS
jgi:transposase